MLHYLVLLVLWTLCIHPAHCQCPPNIETIQKSIVEGVPSDTPVYSFDDHFPNVPNRHVLVEIQGSNLMNVFGEHFRYTDYEDGPTGGNFWTQGTFDREVMARSLGNTVAPVRFNVSVAILNDNTVYVVKCYHLLITVEDIDDNVPTFAVPRFSVTFNDDNHRVNESRPLLLATDDDEGINGTQHYSLLDNLGVFYLDVRRNEEMQITFVQLRNRIPLDRENRSSYQLTLVASEGNSNADNATLIVDVMIAAVCDEPPEFITSRYTPSLPENSTMGTG